MEYSFTYDKPVVGRANIGRKADAEALAEMLRQGRHAVIYEPPKSGKSSLVQQTFALMNAAKDPFVVLEANLLGLRSIRDVVLELGSQMICSVARTAQEISESVGRFFSGTPFRYDDLEYKSTGRILDINHNISVDDILTVFGLPERIAAETGRRVYLVIDEFQEILFTEDHICILDAMKAALAGSRYVGFIVCGSRVNAMKSLFPEADEAFTRLPLSRIHVKDIAYYMTKSFLSKGKVIEQSQIEEICAVTRCNPWYINHFCAICDGLSRGYVMNTIVKESLDAMIAVYEPRFRAVMADLTNYQISFLKAVLEGCTRFSSLEVITVYGLNSSANVNRIKDALCKKEIITLDEEDSRIEILDPLFEYWASRYYFKTNSK